MGLICIAAACCLYDSVFDIFFATGLFRHTKPRFERRGELSCGVRADGLRPVDADLFTGSSGRAGGRKMMFIRYLYDHPSEKQDSIKGAILSLF